MGNYSKLIEEIQNRIKTNGAEEITGDVLQQTLVNVTESLGKNPTFGGFINLENQPEDVDQNVFYIATEKGLYDSLNLEITELGLVFPKEDGSWEVKSFPTNVPISPGTGVNSFVQNSESANSATGEGSSAIGSGTKAQGSYSHAEGQKSFAGMTGIGAHAEGYSSQAQGVASHAEGYFTNCFGEGAHSEGRNTEATGDASHAEGLSTMASGKASHAGGVSCRVTGEAGFAHGKNLNSDNDYEAVFGKFNKSKEGLLFSVGGGSDANDRKNVFEVHEDGTVYSPKLSRVCVTGVLIELTHAELREMKESEELIPGVQYRITDYSSEIIPTDRISGFGGHQFDIVVTATGPSSLSEIAKATFSVGDSYFSEAGANLDAWQIWYRLVADERTPWVDPGGSTGVIYRMIDEWGNDLPYDFKNVILKGPEGEDVYTFDRSGEDSSLIEYARNIKISEECAPGVVVFYGSNSRINILGRSTSGDERTEIYIHSCANGTMDVTNTSSVILTEVDGFRLDSGLVNIEVGEGASIVRGIHIGSDSYSVTITPEDGGLIENVDVGRRCLDVTLKTRDDMSDFKIGDDCYNIKLLCGETSHGVVIGPRCGTVEFDDNGTDFRPTLTNVQVGSDCMDVYLFTDVFSNITIGSGMQLTEIHSEIPGGRCEFRNIEIKGGDSVFVISPQSEDSIVQNYIIDIPPVPNGGPHLDGPYHLDPDLIYPVWITRSPDGTLVRSWMTTDGVMCEPIE